MASRVYSPEFYFGRKGGGGGGGGGGSEGSVRLQVPLPSSQFALLLPKNVPL